ncbi:superoxide dismutase [Cu-Zn] SodC [Candidatus Fukatsuia symbiotica]|uniref:Superoxide dismutase [Cu-Zn] n=1 Tax=Candidatus Fukatsuia symbiotica TaxID=1878942 RepID=A0A2Y9CKE5_9GAMM|nr:superoxide dismutase family protein [Candidatus Fukatsuia symbiotica]AWK15379.1 superoxide dismutase [Cu-Zn] SodC1 [Candidatus Fukatsuia symbiotica]MEA9444716.1 superoxide dismutase [Cu-Zn] SodC [Candidatus Fukatsuia symbiotica]
MKFKKVILFSLLFSGVASASNLTVKMHEATPSGNGNYIGDITLAETSYGVIFAPDLKNLTPGIHGFHVHQNPSCQPGEKEGKAIVALQAGGHLNLNTTGGHLGPYNDQGHLGDLPGLPVNDDGMATYAVLAPRIKSLKEIENRSLMIHINGDNYSDHPQALGGGGARFACGVIANGVVQ